MWVRWRFHLSRVAVPFHLTFSKMKSLLLCLHANTWCPWSKTVLCFQLYWDTNHKILCQFTVYNVMMWRTRSVKRLPQSGERSIASHRCLFLCQRRNVRLQQPCEGPAARWWHNRPAWPSAQFPGPLLCLPELQLLVAARGLSSSSLISPEKGCEM